MQVESPEFCAKFLASVVTPKDLSEMPRLKMQSLNTHMTYVIPWAGIITSLSLAYLLHKIRGLDQIASKLFQNLQF